MLDLSVLNPEQKSAVLQTEGPLLVLAGAGSGKTRVLTYRIAHMIENGVPAWSILAITFTNKAAREMRERVMSLSGDSAADAWVSTFHSCCARILRRDIEKLGYRREFTIYDDDDQTTLIKRISTQLRVDEKQFPPRAIRAVISDAKNRMLTPHEWLTENGSDFRSRVYEEVYTEYERQLKANNALDFDDLILKTLELFSEHPPVLESYLRKFSHILVDEYQDTNMAQYMLIRILSGEKKNVCVVGDDDQSIYGWRGADLRNILEFEKDFPNCKTVKLEQNYRSTSTILDAANQVIAHNEGRKEKALWTKDGEGDKIVLYRALDEREEAAWVCDQIGALKRQGYREGDIAILYRTNAQSRVLEEAMVRRGIRYTVYGGLKFYDRREVKNMVAYLRALINPDDDISVRRIINEPRRGIGDATVDLLAEYARQNEMSLLNAAFEAERAGLTARALTSVNRFSELMLSLIEQMAEQTPTEFISTLLSRTEIQKQYENDKDPENQARIENIREFVSAVTEYDQQNPDEGILGFLENVALVTDLDKMDERAGMTLLMTLHSAKGLEFPAVFLTGLEEGIFPISRATFDESQLEEERRLMYVGLTRAKKRLFLSGASTRMLYNARQANPVSRFVSEIPPRLFEDGRKRQSAPTRLPPPSARPLHPHATSAVLPKANALGIPGLQKGFVPSQARAAGQSAPVTLFKAGDTVMHRTLGTGTVLELRDTPNGRRVVIDFEGKGEKVFPADTAPIVKVG